MPSWRKYFTNIHGQQSPVAGRKNNNSVNASRFQSWLPEVYVGQHDRIQKYFQYSIMDLDSEINTALDTIAEFSTIEDTTTGTPFTIQWQEEPAESESEVVVTVLKQWCRINDWNQRMFRVFRNAIKFGDQPLIRDPETWKLYWIDPADVVKVIIDESKGKEPQHYSIKNLDANFQNLVATGPKAQGSYASASISDIAGVSSAIGSGPINVGNLQTMRANIEQLVEAHHIIHISLTDGLDAVWPFGTSVLEPVFKTYKQKELLEDSIIIYRVQRAPERRVFYIDVGDMPPHIAMAHVDRIKKEIHQRRVPSRSGSGSTLMDTQYNPMGILEDFFLTTNSEGRGTKIDTLAGSTQLGEIDDLKFFNNKLARGLRIPSSYLPTGPDDGTASYNDGRVGTAFIQEFRFSKFCERLQKIIQPTLDAEFKLFIKHRGYQVDSNQFELMFVEPQSFSQFRDIEIDGARIGVFGQIEGVPYISKRFAVRKYLGLTEDEMLENEQLWKEENPVDDGDESTEDMSGLGDIGVGGGPAAGGGIEDFAAEEPVDDFAAGDELPDDGIESPISGSEGIPNENP